MQDYGGGSSKPGECRDSSAEAHDRPEYHGYVMQGKTCGGSSKDGADPNMATYCRVASSIYEATSTAQQYQNSRYSNASAPTFSSPPNSPLVGLVFDPGNSSYGATGMTGERRPQNWIGQEPIGTGAKKKIVKSQDKSAGSRNYKDNNDSDRQKKHERNLTSESTSSLDFFTEGEKMVSELCNISESRAEDGGPKQNKATVEEEQSKTAASNSSELLLSVLDKIVIHDQIPNQIVQLAIEACTDAENIAIAHHNRPCFKNIHSICAKTRSNVQKPDSAVANLHSQGIPWVIKNFIFSFVRILDGWKGVKELLSEKHDTFSRIENKYYSPNIRECFVQWQAVTKEMLTHIYKTFKCLDHGFTMEQKSFTHNYYATNSAAPRHQNQKFQASKTNISNPRPINPSPLTFNAMQPHWVQTQNQSTSQNFNEVPWPVRQPVAYKKIPVVPPPSSQNFYQLNEPIDYEAFQKSQYKYDPCGVREAKPRQSWTITNVPDFRSLESLCHSDQRELYNQLKQKMDAELVKAPGQSFLGNVPCDLMQRREMELKSKMIPLSHVEKGLLPGVAATEMRGYVQKNNSCGDTKEEADFFAAWGQMVHKEPNQFITHHPNNVQSPTNVVISNNITGPVQFLDAENDEFHEMSRVYMKPGSYKVPIKATDPISSFTAGVPTDMTLENIVSEEIKVKTTFPAITLAPQPKYNLESWPCLMSKRSDEVSGEDTKFIPKYPYLDMRPESLDVFGVASQDRAWEAAKQSTTKLIDFIHEGSKTDTARLYDALGLNTNDELPDDFKEIKLCLEQQNSWSGSLPPNHFFPKDSFTVWNKSSKNDELTNDDTVLYENKSSQDTDAKNEEAEEMLCDQNTKTDEVSETKRCPSFDQTGICVKDDNQKKGRSKTSPSGMWYHPKKKKPLPANVVKKFENVIINLSQIKESAFIQYDMDIKVAPRFYEVVKYPMCLQDILTKLKNFSYTEHEHVVQDFRRIFNNVRLYLKSHPDVTMKKNINKVSNEFEKILNEEFQHKNESKSKTDPETNDNSTKRDAENKDYDDSSKKNDPKIIGGDKKV